MTGRRTPSAIARTARRSPSDALGNPASITSTPSVSSWRARRSFSSAVTELPGACSPSRRVVRSEEHTSELQSRLHLVCRLLLEKKKNTYDRVVAPHVPASLSTCNISYFNANTNVHKSLSMYTTHISSFIETTNTC